MEKLNKQTRQQQAGAHNNEAGRKKAQVSQVESNHGRVRHLGRAILMNSRHGSHEASAEAGAAISLCAGVVVTPALGPAESDPVRVEHSSWRKSRLPSQCRKETKENGNLHILFLGSPDAAGGRGPGEPHTWARLAARRHTHHAIDPGPLDLVPLKAAQAHTHGHLFVMKYIFVSFCYLNAHQKKHSSRIDCFRIHPKLVLALDMIFALLSRESVSLEARRTDSLEPLVIHEAGVTLVCPLLATGYWKEQEQDEPSQIARKLNKSRKEAHKKEGKVQNWVHLLLLLPLLLRSTHLWLRCLSHWPVQLSLSF